MRISTGCNNKATEIELGNLTVYISYSTVIGFYTPATGRVFCENVWSNTTGRHFNHFGAGDKSTRTERAKFLKMWAKIEKKLDNAFKAKLKIAA